MKFIQRLSILAALLVPSAGMGMNAVLMQAAGAGPKPALVLTWRKPSAAPAGTC